MGKRRNWRKHKGSAQYLKSSLATTLVTEEGAEETLSTLLWKETAELRHRALDSYFVEAMRFGILDPVRFGEYTVQDAVYIYKTTEAIDIAKERAEDEDIKKILEEKSESYREYYKAMFEEWRIAKPDGINLGEEAATYAEYVKAVASEKSDIYFIVAMSPCAKLWPWLGKKLALKKSNYGVYHDWVTENFDPTDTGYKEFDLKIDEYYARGAIKKEEALEVFKNCMKGEAEFFASIEP